MDKVTTMDLQLHILSWLEVVSIGYLVRVSQKWHPARQEKYLAAFVQAITPAVLTSPLHGAWLSGQQFLDWESLQSTLDDLKTWQLDRQHLPRQGPGKADETNTSAPVRDERKWWQVRAIPDSSLDNSNSYGHLLRMRLAFLRLIGGCSCEGSSSTASAAAAELRLRQAAWVDVPKAARFQTSEAKKMAAATRAAEVAEQASVVAAAVLWHINEPTSVAVESVNWRAETVRFALDKSPGYLC